MSDDEATSFEAKDEDEDPSAITEEDVDETLDALFLSAYELGTPYVQIDNNWRGRIENEFFQKGELAFASRRVMCWYWRLQGVGWLISPVDI